VVVLFHPAVGAPCFFESGFLASDKIFGDIIIFFWISSFLLFVIERDLAVVERTKTG
jgi:hypothetical protein